MAVSGFSLLLAAVSALAALASVAVPATADQPDAAARRIEVPADELSDVLRPAETPPPDFNAGQYIDSSGCVFLRTDGGWRGRIERDGAPVCGYPPTLSARRTDPDSVAALFAEPGLPRAARIERDLTQAIIPNLQAAELVAAAVGNRREDAGAPATPPTVAASAVTDAQRSRTEAPPDPLHIGPMVARAPGLARQMAGTGRTDRLCALIGGSPSASLGPGLALCGTGPRPLAVLSGTGPAGARGKDADGAGATVPGTTKVADGGAERRAARGRDAEGARPGPTSSTAERPPQGDKRMIPAGARFVQVGSFRDAQQAQAAAARLARMGLPVVRARQGQAQLVMVGPLDGREAIVRMIERLRGAGYRDLRARR